MEQTRFGYFCGVALPSAVACLGYVFDQSRKFLTGAWSFLNRDDIRLEDVFKFLKTALLAVSLGLVWLAMEIASGMIDDLDNELVLRRLKVLAACLMGVLAGTIMIKLGLFGAVG